VTDLLLDEQVVEAVLQQVAHIRAPSFRTHRVRWSSCSDCAGLSIAIMFVSGSSVRVAMRALSSDADHRTS
jgi:hypothetical protein